MPAQRRIRAGPRDPDRPARLRRSLVVTAAGDVLVRYEWRGFRQTRRYADGFRWARLESGAVRLWDGAKWDVLRLTDEEVAGLPPRSMN